MLLFPNSEGSVCTFGKETSSFLIETKNFTAQTIGKFFLTASQISSQILTQQATVAQRRQVILTSNIPLTCVPAMFTLQM